ncbi:glycoside hydrolase family 97 protein [Dysgonomonas reticulitermitis]
MKNVRIFLILLISIISLTIQGKEVESASPDGSLKVRITVKEQITMQVFQDKILLFEVKGICLITDKGMIPVKKADITSVKRSSVNRMIIPEIREKKAKIPEKYNELLLNLSDKTRLQFRIFNDGVAYRLITEEKGELVIRNEFAEFVFDETSILTLQEDARMNSDYEAPYVTKKIKEVKAGTTGNCPALVKTPSGTNILFMESDVVDYPCLWLRKGEQNLEAHFWEYPKTYNENGSSFNRRRILTTEDYIAKTQGTREFPWRVFAIGKNDMDLLTNQLVYILAPECKIEDTSWIKPGWVTFDWWARRGLYNVDFKAGINTATAKYMIDFASDFGIPYFLFDDGWTHQEDLTCPIDGLDMKEVVDYATSKNVGVMLWVTYDLIDNQMDKALKKFSEWGIKGLKIDFINRSDQKVCNFYWKAAEQAARYKMVLDFHGAYRPDGMRRAYPNVLTREALIEFEQSGGKYEDNPDHHCTMPFIRNVAGPMDYIPGTMNNATQKLFRFNPDTPMGQGTRAHSMALAVITESPMQMLPDPQSDYYREEECARFLTNIPVEWDEIIPLQGKIGDYIALSRRNGESWYVAAITDWTPRTLELDFDFLPEGKNYTMEIFADGMNADKRAIDYKRKISRVKKGDRITVDMVSGGGWVSRIYESSK